jgi:hypothetical protein
MRKKDLMQIIAEQIYEMAMDYDSDHRPNPGIEDKLKTGNTPLNKIPFPERKSGDKNFLEFLASQRYKEVVEKVKRYLSGKIRMNLKGDERFGELMEMMKDASNTIMSIERGHEKELENLAVNLTIKNFQIPDGLVKWDVKLTPLKEMTLDNFEIEDEKGEINPEAVNIEQEIYNDLEDLNLENAKRRFINTLTQGAAEKGHYIFHMVPDELKKITGNDTLSELYGIMMSVNDAMYWQYDDDNIDSKFDNPNFHPAGTEEVEPPEDEDGLPTIVVRAVNFPVMIHECFKGYMDFMATHGIPKNNAGEYDLDKWEKIQKSEDTLNKETWDIRLGPVIWSRILDLYPDDVTAKENFPTIQNFFLKSVYSLPAKNFLVLMKEIMGQTKTGVRLLGEMLKSAEEMVKQMDYEESMSIFHDDLEKVTDDTPYDDIEGFIKSIPGVTTSLESGDDSEDNMKDFLGSLGIKFSEDDDYDDIEDDDDGGVPVQR